MRRMGLLMTVALIATLGIGNLAMAQLDPTMINVLRQYDPATGTVVVASTVQATGAGTSIWRHAANDGSGWNDEGKLEDGGTITRTFTLPGTCRVGGYRAEFEGAPAVFTLEGSMDGETWTELVTLTDLGHSDKPQGTFDPADVNYIRYIATGPTTDASNYYRMPELQVFLAAGETVGLSDGYNVFPQVVSSWVLSADSAVWARPNGGNGDTLNDMDFWGHLKAQNISAEGGNRAFVAYALTEAVPMNFASLGCYKDQAWSAGWEMYTANGDDIPELQNLGANDPATIQAAGWTLQREGAGTQVDEFSLAAPGTYKYVALVWTVTGGGAVEFELFNGQVPLKVSAFEVAAQGTGDTAYTESRTVDVTAFAATQSYLGTAITGYMITQSDVPPALDDEGWSSTPPQTYEITGNPGDKTLYGWAKDDAGQIGFATHTIYYRDPLAPPPFGDVTRVNVLRQYDPATGTVVVPSQGQNLWSNKANDGAGGSEETQLQDGQTASRTYTLPGTRRVGGYRAEFEGAPAVFTIEGSMDGENWTELVTLTGLGQNDEPQGTFQPTDVNYIRYTATGPTTDENNYFRLYELHIYLAEGEYATLADGFNNFADQVAATCDSEDNLVWSRRNGDAAAGLADLDFDQQVKCQNVTGGSKAFVAFKLNIPTPMNIGSLGGYKGQGWTTFECYTANGETMPELQNLANNDRATLEAAGWTFQYAKTEGSRQESVEFPFQHGGEWQYVALLWPAGEWGACAEFETFYGEVPIQVTQFFAADQVTGDTTYTEERTVDITIAGAPSHLGTVINGYMVTETPEAPGPADWRWSSEPPTDYTILGPSGLVTLYGWIRDDAGQVAGASHQIEYFDPLAPPKFKDPTKANVLRQYDPDDTESPVAVPYSNFVCTGGASAWRHGANDGGAWNDEGAMPTDVTSTISKTFTLREQHTVGSFMAHFEPYPTQFILDGSNDGETWFNLTTVNPTANLTTGTFEPQACSYIRYTAVGPMSREAYFRLVELRVFKAEPEVSLYDGLNFFADQNPDGIVAATGGVWTAPNGGNAITLKDADYSGHLKCQATPYGDFHCFAAYTFENFPVYMHYGSMGYYKDQGWMSGWDCYTSAAEEMPEVQNIPAPAEGETIQDKLIEAGWVLQYSSPGVVNVDEFEFAVPDQYKHILFVFDSAQGGAVEFELFSTGPRWPIPGDSTLDCKVNILDLIFVRNRLNLNPNTGDNWRADVNEDGKINILDLIFTRNHLNTTCSE